MSVACHPEIGVGRWTEVLSTSHFASSFEPSKNSGQAGNNRLWSQKWLAIKREQLGKITKFTMRAVLLLVQHLVACVPR